MQPESKFRPVIIGIELALANRHTKSGNGRDVLQLTIEIVRECGDFCQIDASVFERYFLNGCGGLAVCRQRRN
jgi:hypothetical protein